MNVYRMTQVVGGESKETRLWNDKELDSVYISRQRPELRLIGSLGDDDRMTFFDSQPRTYC